MPLARYFVFVGAALLALLFVVDAEMPSSTTVNTAEANTANTSSDLSAIRIKSDRKWPDRVDFDTRIPQRAAVQTARNGNQATAPAKVADSSAPANVRESFAQLAPSDLKPSNPKPSDLKQAELKHREIRRLQRRRIASRIAKRRVVAPTVLAARQTPFGFFANNIW
jgi:hypothetical protein